MINETEKLVSTFEEEMQKMRSIQEIVDVYFELKSKGLEDDVIIANMKDTILNFKKTRQIFNFSYWIYMILISLLLLSSAFILIALGVWILR